MKNSEIDTCHFDLAIIGGGVGGLSAAFYAVTQLNKKVIIIERENNLGGMASGIIPEQAGSEEWIIDKYYHHWFSSDDHLFSLAESAGLKNKILKKNIKTGILDKHKKIWSVTSALELLGFRMLPLLSRLRLGFLGLMTRIAISPQILHRFRASTVVEFIAGTKVLNAIWMPLLRSKFGDRAEEISAAWLWSKINLRAKNLNQGRESLFYYEGGMQAFVNDLKKHLESVGVRFMFDAECRSLGKELDLFCLSVSTPDGGSLIRSLKVVLSGKNLAKKMIPSDIWDRRKAVGYSGLSMANVCVVLELDSRLSEYYWISVVDKDFPWVALIEHTNLVDSGFYGGKHIIYLSRYCDESSVFFKKSNAELIELAVQSLRGLECSKGKRFDVLGGSVNRVTNCQPVVIAGDDSDKFSKDFQDIFVIALEGIFPEDRGTNYAVREGKLAVNYLFSESAAT